MLTRKPKPTEDDTRAEILKALREHKPVIRTTLAFLIYLFKEDRTIGECYRDGNQFVTNLVRDVKGEEEDEEL